jgi:uncharacterized membrane protein
VLFILVLALIKNQGSISLIPLVQELFVLAFILLALFQEIGHEAIGAGRALAVQNLTEDTLIRA